MTIRPAQTGIIAIGVIVAFAAIQQASGQPGDAQPAAIHASNAITAPAAPPAATQLISKPADEIHNLRVRKCAAIVNALYPNSGFAEHVDYFITTHEEYGIADEWQWSLAYGGANFSLQCGVRARNGCAGPMDRPGGSTNAHKNITAHCRETAGFHEDGLRGYRLMQKVFYPAAPHDWGGKRILKAYIKHVRFIEKAYQEGWL